VSAIFGIAHFDGRPVSPSSLSALDAALSGWGPDGVTFWRDDSAAIGLRLLATTPEAHCERPFVLPDGAVVVTAARLDNRDDLCDEFDVAASARISTSDGALAAMAYERWRTQCPTHLLGDWSLAAWDPTRRRLFLARDPLGSAGLYYIHDGTRFAFATTAAALRSLSSAGGAIDEEQLARYLAYCENDPGRTMWAGVRRILPAHALTATPEGVRIDRYWSVSDARPVRLRDAREYESAFLEHYRRAVRIRLRSKRPVGATLSAGLDSSSVTALAAEALATRGERLVALTAVPRHDADHLNRGRLGDEWPIAHSLAAKWPQVIEHVAVGREALSPIDGIDAALTALAEPIPAASNAYWIVAVIEQARQLGLGVLLIGQHGNSGISWDGGLWRIASLLAERQWRVGVEALAQARRRKGVSWPRIIAGQIVRPLLWSLPRLPRLGLNVEQRSRTYGMIHPDLIRRFEIPKPTFKPVFRLPSAEREPMLLSGALAAVIWQSYGSAFGIEVRDPTGDQRLVEFCLGVPHEQFIWQGVPRSLLVRATKDLVPSTFHENTVRGRQAADVVLRLLADRDRVETELVALAAHPALAGRLNGDALVDEWRRVCADPVVGAAELLRGVMAAKLLKRTYETGPLG
jgi:asparagine synthase (glutamine-hydrolysing)